MHNLCKKIGKIIIFSAVIFISMEVKPQDIPQEPSISQVNGHQLMVKRAGVDDNLQSYIIKGVNWSPATRAPQQGPNPLEPSQTVEYGFFFDWLGRNPQGHDILDYWKKSEVQSWCQTDLALIKSMHANTVRLYHDLGDSPDVYNSILDECYRNGVMVIMTVVISKEDIENKKHEQVVGLYKDHPAILAWSLGNEWNLESNKLYGYSTVSEAAAAINTAAAEVKAIDANHAVTSCLGDRFFDSNHDNEISAIVSVCSNIDFWGLNIYRGMSFGDLFTQWQAVTEKPFYVSEFGTDSFYTESFTIVNGYQADDCLGDEDEDSQADFDISLWREISDHLSFFDSAQLCIGGLVHEFNDSLWKVGSYHVNLGGLIDYDDPVEKISYGDYNSEGFYLPCRHLDAVSNEEYFGVVAADRTPKKVFGALKEYYEELDNGSLSSKKVTNVSGTKVVVSWITNDVTTGYINYGSTSLLGNIAYDVRGETFEGKTHYVEIENLESPQAIYYYTITCGGVDYDNGGNPFILDTGSITPPQADSHLIYGQVFLSDGVTPAAGTLVYIKLKDGDESGTLGESQIVSSLTDADGYWYYDLSNLRTVTLDNYFEYSQQGGDNIQVNFKGVEGESKVLTIDTSTTLPVEAITLTPNIAPMLEWTGEPGYEDKGVNPQMGYGETVFMFRIKYIDVDNDAPAVRNLYLDRNGDNDYFDNGEVILMQAQDSDYANGVIYTYTTKIAYSANSQNCSYYFSFSDGEDFAVGSINQAISEETAINNPDVFQTLSVNLDKTIWALPQIDAGSYHLTNDIDKAGVTNTGDGFQTYSLRITDQGQWQASSDKNGAGIDTFVVSAVFTESEKVEVTPSYFNEIGNDDVITGVGVDAGQTQFAGSQSVQTGALVGAGETRNLWFEFKAPQKDTKGGDQTIKITVNAQIP